MTVDGVDKMLNDSTLPAEKNDLHCNSKERDHAEEHAPLIVLEGLIQPPGEFLVIDTFLCCPFIDHLRRFPDLRNTPVHKSDPVADKEKEEIDEDEQRERFDVTALSAGNICLCQYTRTEKQRKDASEEFIINTEELLQRIVNERHR